MQQKLIDALQLCFDKPPEEAVAYLESQGFKVTHNWREALDAIREHCFTVSKVAAADTLQTIHDELNKSMKAGLSYNDFKSNMPKILQQKGVALKDDGSAFRYELMYRMNMQSAYQNGQFFQMEEANNEFPYREFVAIEDTRTSSTCKQLNGVVVRYDDPVYLTNQTPRHFNCRSTWMSLTADDAKKKGINKKDLSKLKPAVGFGLNPHDAKYKPNMEKYAEPIKKVLKPAISDEKLAEWRKMKEEEKRAKKEIRDIKKKIKETEAKIAALDKKQ